MPEKEEEEKEEGGKKKGAVGKQILEFGDKLLPIFAIEKVEKEERWNDIREAQDFLIVINREIPLGGSSIIDMEFIYQDAEFRDKKFKELRDKLAAFKWINII